MSDLINLAEADTKDVSGKIVIITGGGSGIGLATAILLASKGAIIHTFDFKMPPSDTLVPEKILFTQVDVTDWERLSTAFKCVVDMHGRIDYVYANAGIGEGGHLFQDSLNSTTGELLPPNWSVMDVNVKGVMQTVKLAVYWFRKLSIKGGIVMSASICGYESAGIPMYTAGKRLIDKAFDKHAVIGLLRSSSLGLHEQFGISLNAVSPGLTKTNIRGVQVKSQNAAPKEIGTLERQSADKVAIAVGYLFSQGPKCFGKSILSNGGRYRELESIYERHRNELLGGEMDVPSVADPAWRDLFRLTF